MYIYREQCGTPEIKPCYSLKKKEGRRMKKEEGSRVSLCMMGSATSELYFVFMNFDPEYDRLQADRTKQGELDSYLSNKHDELLASKLEPGTYKKMFSLVIVDGFAVEITDAQANLLRSAKEVRVVEKNQELV